MIWMDVDTALPELPVNLLALIDSTDFKTREESVTFDQAGLDLLWNFVTTAGVFSQVAVTPTDTTGDYDWINQGNGMYTIEMPFSGGASMNNDSEGHGWFTGFATGILPWISPVFGFRAAALNNALIDGGDNLEVDLTHIMNTILTEGAGGRNAAAFIKLFDVATPTLVASDVMRGTNSALLATTFSTMFSGMSVIAHWFGMLAGKQAANATALTELKATGAGSGTYDPTTDSTEAIRDHATTIKTETAQIGTAADTDIATDIAAVKARVDALFDTIGIIKNTALTNFEFLMIDSTDDISGKTGLTITAERSIDGGAFASMANSASEVSAGLYKINLAQADTNGDVITYKFTSAGANATVVTIRTTST